MKCKMKSRWAVMPLAIAAFATLTTLGFQSCSDDLLEGQPSWLGNSIYERLAEDGNYTYTLRMIDDLGMHDVLSQTGSKTIFVADDDAYKEWFKTNKWGVRDYKDLTKVQKTMLVNTQMLDNAYLVELLSNAKSKGDNDTPEPGMVMRRMPAGSVYDTVYTVKPADMPAAAYWNTQREKAEGIALLKDDKVQPVVMFLPQYMKKNKITDEDLSIITNGVATSVNDAFINGKKILEIPNHDITCKNGYIHKMSGVVEPVENMALLIHDNPNTKEWAKLLDRFSAPWPATEAQKKEYNRLYSNTDSLYVLRYFDDLDHRFDMEDKAVKARLAFDPGMNQFMYKNTMGQDFTYDCAGMFVPSDQALNTWLNGPGKALITEYGCLDSIPDLVISKLVKVNMIENFADKVPSKFKNITNDAKNEMGILKSDVDSCSVGCNGVIYWTNLLRGPAEYSSVTFPALVGERSTYSVFYNALDDYEYSPYLHSMDTEYSLLMPTNDAMLWYIDPINAGENTQTLLRFRYDNTVNKIKLSRYEYTLGPNGEISLGRQVQQEAVFTNNTIKDNRLKDMIEGLIVVGSINDGHEYYKTKGGSLVRVIRNGGELTVQGGWQLENNVQIPAKNVFSAPKSEGGNGWSYELSKQMPLGGTRSVYSLLRNTPEYSEFFALMDGGDPDSTAYNVFVKQTGGDNGKYDCANKIDNFNVSLFDNYNYTVYVPTNESIRAMIDAGQLPTWDDFDLWHEKINTAGTEAEVKQAKQMCYIIKNRINNFLRYHIQDNSLAIGMPATTKDEAGAPVYGGKYETMVINPANKRFYSLNVSFDDNNMTIKDARTDVASAKVLTKAGKYNNICKEYWFAGSGNNRTIYQSSDAVVHLIDRPLIYNASQLTRWNTTNSRRK